MLYFTFSVCDLLLLRRSEFTGTVSHTNRRGSFSSQNWETGQRAANSPSHWVLKIKYNFSQWKFAYFMHFHHLSSCETTQTNMSSHGTSDCRRTVRDCSLASLWRSRSKTACPARCHRNTLCYLVARSPTMNKTFFLDESHWQNLHIQIKGSYLSIHLSIWLSIYRGFWFCQ